MSVYWPRPGVSFLMSFVRSWLRNSAAAAPLTVTSPMCEISKIPTALRTARCSSVMLVYCTGISQPPKSISFAPSFLCASNNAVRFSISSPLLGEHLLLGNAHVGHDHSLRVIDQLIRAAGVEHRVRHIDNLLLRPRGVNAPAPSDPGILRREPRAGDVKAEMRILVLHLPELGVEDDVVRRADAVENGDAGLRLAPRGLADKSPERRHARAAGDADQMLVGFIDRQELA